MSKGRRKAELILTDDERQTLKTWASRPKSTQQLAQRARIVLACADGMDNKQVAAKLSVTVQTVGKWRRRFLERRVDGLTDQERPGAPRKITDKDVEEVISKTLETKPKSATHWSTRGMAEATGMSQSSISRIWRRVWIEAPPYRDVQALQRPVLHREGSRCCRPVHEPAGPSDRALHRREEPDPSLGPYATPVAHAARTDRTSNA